MSKPHTVSIQRTNPLGETIMIEVEIDSRESIESQWATKVQPFLKCAESRFQELNTRVLAVTAATMQMRPDEADRVRQILAIVSGFMPPSVDGLKARLDEQGIPRAKQWVDDVSPDKQDVDMTHDVENPDRALVVVK